ncbi:MAG: biotin/lipoyl-containing protein [Chloroflexota bacterium]
MRYFATIEGEEYIIDIGKETISVGDETYHVDFMDLAERGMFSLLINNRSIEAVVEEEDEATSVLIKGELYSVKVQDERTRRLAEARGETADSGGELVIKSPMPGIVIATPAEVGQVVEKGDQIIILESMKMENELRAPRGGIVTRVAVTPGTSVEKDQVLAIIGDEEES